MSARITSHKYTSTSAKQTRKRTQMYFILHIMCLVSYFAARAGEKLAFWHPQNVNCYRNTCSDHTTIHENQRLPSTNLHRTIHTEHTTDPHRELHRPVTRRTSLLSRQVLRFLTANRRENTFIRQAYLPRTETYSCRSVRNAHMLRGYVWHCFSLTFASAASARAEEKLAFGCSKMHFPPISSLRQSKLIT